MSTQIKKSWLTALLSNQAEWWQAKGMPGNAGTVIQAIETIDEQRDYIYCLEDLLVNIRDISAVCEDPYTDMATIHDRIDAFFTSKGIIK